MSYRGVPREVRQALLERRDGLRERALALTDADRARLSKDLARELDALEGALEAAASDDAVCQAESRLDEYEAALDAALDAAQLDRDKRRRMLRVTAIIVGVLLIAPGIRFTQEMLRYDVIEEACATGFHCRHAGECGMRFFLDSDVGFKLACTPTEPEHCQKAVRCREFGWCHIRGDRCGP